MQRGQLIEASGFIYIRFYRGGKRVAEKLCEIDDVHYSVKAKKVRALAAEFMLKESKNPTPSSRLTVAEFWVAHYLPWAEANLRPSSVHGYEKLWGGVLKGHFDGRTLADYRVSHGYEFLAGLQGRMSRASLQHVRSLASGVFSLAVNKDFIPHNVWREVQSPKKAKAVKPTGWYTLGEAKAAIEKLSGDARCQTAFGLCFYLALRPGEVIGLRFEDFEDGHVHIRRSVWRTHVGETKTGEELRVPLIEPARVLMEKWRGASGSPSEGWLFPNSKGKPVAAASLTRRMKEMLGPSWKVLYSARRGMATTLTELTGNPISAQGMLRHRSLATSVNHYVRQMPEQTQRGMAMVEEKLAEKK